MPAHMRPMDNAMQKAHRSGLFAAPAKAGTSWLREKDLNLRPLGYEPNELPDCSIARYFFQRWGHLRHPLRRWMNYSTVFAGIRRYKKEILEFMQFTKIFFTLRIAKIVHCYTAGQESSMERPDWKWGQAIINREGSGFSWSLPDRTPQAPESMNTASRHAQKMG